MPTFSIADIISQLQQAQKQANDANLQRYNKGLSELNAGRSSMRQYYAQAQSLVQDIGKSALEDVDRGSERAFAQGRQSLISSGLNNTTLTANLARSTEEDRQRGSQRVREGIAQNQANIAQNQAGAETNASGNIASFIAARNDSGPDIGQYAGLIRDAAGANTLPVQAQLPPRQGGGGGGGGGGGSIGNSPFKFAAATPGGNAYTEGNVDATRAAGGGGVYGQGGQALSPIAKASQAQSKPQAKVPDGYQSFKVTAGIKSGSAVGTTKTVQARDKAGAAQAAGWGWRVA